MDYESAVPGKLHVAAPPARATVVYDNACGFCRRWVARWRGLTGDAVDYEPFQTGAGGFPEVPLEDFRRATHLIEPDGLVTRGAEAVFRALSIGGRKKLLLRSYEHVPGFAPTSEAFYRLVASHRGFFSILDRWLLGNNTLPVSYENTRRWFLRALGVIYFIAFLSLGVQIEGLIGSQGILPISRSLDMVRGEAGGPSFDSFPTLLWLNSSDGMLRFLCIGGAGLSLLLIAGIVPVLVAFLLWLFYLSLTVAGQDFLGFQWDALLLEAGFLAIFFAPLQLLPLRSREGAPSRIIVWLYRWLLFRLMFLSALVKWVSGDTAWRNGTAMEFHYWTQPLPPWTAWYVHLLPGWFHHLSVTGVFFIEGFIPFLFFAPRQLRLLAFWFTIALQLLILATGNFGFFNLLAIVLCIPLLNDTFWPFRLREKTIPTDTRRGIRWSPLLTAPMAAVLVLLSIISALHRAHIHVAWPASLQRLAIAAEPFQVANPYGLFEVMTTRRPEIIIEGSDDAAHWIPYEFKWKPGDIYRRPGYCVPHMPRLDWQMWFAALAWDEERQPSSAWFFEFLRKLLEGSPPVTELLAKTPFAGHPPKYVRAIVYRYRFTTPEEKAQTGAWWARTPTGMQTRPIMLDANGRLTVAEPATE